MRIKTLDLRAFGPFSNRVLDFSSPTPGLHIVFGLNEAGKSSCLRALHALFFGIQVQTPDNFLHPYDQLLIGGCLQTENGESLTFFRRKKRKSDLFDAHDNPLDPTQLSSFLQGMESETFKTLYGIDHEALVRGGQDILDQKGDVGQAIFAAGAGLTSLHSVLGALEREADDIFRLQGKKQSLNQALSRYRELQTAMKQATLSGHVWHEHQKALKKAEKAQEDARKQRGGKDREMRRLERLQRALPHLGQRDVILEHLEGLGQVIVLPSDFREQRRSLEHRRNEAANRNQAAMAGLREIQEKKEAISLNQDILHYTDEIEAMFQRLGEHCKAGADRPKLEGMRITLRTEAAALLKQIRPDLLLEGVEALRPGLLKRKTIFSLGNQYEAQAQKIEQCNDDMRKKQKALEAVRSELSRMPSAQNPEGIIQAIRIAQKAGDLDKQIEDGQSALELSKKSCLEELGCLGLWSGPLEKVGGLPVPMRETLNRFEKELDSIVEKIKQVNEGKVKLEANCQKISTQLLEITGAGEVPTEEDLFRIRSRRDSGWQLLRRQWVEREDVSEEVGAFSPETPLPKAYENLVIESDQTADRLRREAERVQKHASLQADLQGNTKRGQILAEEMETLKTALAEANGRWQEGWKACGFLPLSPREMKEWVTAFEKLRFNAREIEKTAAEIAGKEEKRRALREALTHELSGLGEKGEFPGAALTPILLRAESVLDVIRNSRALKEKLLGKREELLNELENLQEEREKAENRLGRWKTKWQEALAPLGLPPHTTPDEAGDFIDTLQNCFDKEKEADDLRKRIDGIDRDSQHFTRDIKNLLEKIAPDLMDTETTQGVSTLHARLNGARQDQAVLKRHMEEISILEKEILQTRTVLDSSKKRMTALLALAGCETEERLDKAEQRSEHYLQLKEQLSGTESTLAQIAEGVSLSDLEEQAQQIDPDTLPGKIEAISHEIEDGLDPEIRRLTEEIGQQKNEMAKMDGSSRAAELADSSQQVTAKIRRLAERYIRLKLSMKILLDVIEKYRAENQDPVLEIASRFFKEITLESFRGLRTDMDDMGKAILIGVRPDESWVKVEGMSVGTRDQLYLALRLATLQWRLSFSEPMPFIVDDILINFDDDRSGATIEAFAELAERNQVILFTHHRRVVEIARTVNAGEKVCIHEI